MMNHLHHHLHLIMKPGTLFYLLTTQSLSSNNVDEMEENADKVVAWIQENSSDGLIYTYM